MLQRGLGVGVVIAVVAWSSVDLSACGDKFLRIGRSSRLNGYAAVHPSSILFFVPSTAKPSAVKTFEKGLKRAGHRFQAVSTIESFSSALAAGGVDIVIAAAKDVANLRPHTLSAASRPEILPIVQKANRAVLATLQQQYEHVLELPADKHEALVEIDNLMELRLRAVQVNALNY